MKFFSWKIIFIVLAIIAILIIGICFVFRDKIFFANQTVAVSGDLAVAAVDTTASSPFLFPQKLNDPPKIIKAVYVTGYSAGSKKYLNYLSYLFKNTEINAVVVDIKDYSGLVSYNSGAPDVKKYNMYNGAIKDIDALVRFFHSQNIYVIGRITVFEDSIFSKLRPDLAIYNKEETADLSHPVLWQDNHGLSWVDPASKDSWDYNISLAKDAFLHGFDEMNFDYVRFPSDGKIKNMGFPVWDRKTSKSEVIKEFFKYTRQELIDEKISIDLFGLTTVGTGDMGIGQIIEDAFENFDYISPMVYPSHYADGFIGFSNPAEHPYEVIKYSMDSALNREKIFFDKLTPIPSVNGDSTSGINATVNLSKFRPWLQDFDIGADYNVDMVKAEIRATQDALGSDYNGFMLWNPSNIYTAEAVTKPN